VSAAQYRIVTASGQPAASGQPEVGDADVTAGGGALVIAPIAGTVLRVPFGEITAITEPEPFVVRIILADGTAVELSRLGVMRTQLLAELRDGRGDQAAAASGAIGDPVSFTAVSGGRPAEIRVYDNAVLISTASESERISFSFITAVQAADYIVTVEVSGREPLIVSRLGRRTGELASLLTCRLAEAGTRTAAFLGSLLPGLGAVPLRQAAGLLRDGMAAPASMLDRIHPDLTSTLLHVATLPACRDTIAALSRRTDLAIGFKQLASVRRPATGTGATQAHAVTPHIGGHDSPGGAFRPGLLGSLAASVMSGDLFEAGPFGAGAGAGAWAGVGAPFGEYWAFRALGAGMNGSSQRPMTPRPDTTRGSLLPASEDLAALAVTGDRPTVLAFALGTADDLVVYAELNMPGSRPTVYRADRAELNQALESAGFDPASVGAETVPDDGQWT
jgi:hypothetical protein